jgi:hypothetical protein
VEIIKHVFERVLREPAIKENGDEEMPQGWKEDLRTKEKRMK